MSLGKGSACEEIRGYFLLCAVRPPLQWLNGLFPRRLRQGRR